MEQPENHDVEVISTLEDLRGLKEDWERLYELSPGHNVFTSFDWVWAWCQHVVSNTSWAARIRLQILVLRREGRVTGIVPLVKRIASRAGIAIRMIEFVGGGLGDNYDFLSVGDLAPQLDTILRYFSARQNDWDLIYLRGIPPESNAPKLLRQPLTRTDLNYRVAAETPCGYLPIETDWEGFLKQQPRKIRRTFRTNANRLKRLEADGVRIRIVEQPYKEPGLLEKMSALEGLKRIRGQRVVRIFSGVAGLFESLLQSLGPAGKVYVAVMEHSDRLIAYELGFRCEKKLWACNKSYDPSYAYYSPGTFLTAAVLDYGYANGYREYDFGGGTEAYKFKWTQRFRQNVRLEIWNKRWRSRLAALLYFGIKPHLDRWTSALGAGDVSH